MAIKVNGDLEVQGPKDPQFSNLEKKKLDKNFFKTIHIFLIIYLCLHNLIIPSIVNIYKGSPLLTDIHYWFLFHFICYHQFKKEQSFNYYLVLFGFSGSITRIIFETYMTATVYGKSWGIFSIYLAEVCSIILFFVYIYSFLKVPKKKGLNFSAGTFTALLLGSSLQPVLNSIEIRGEIFNNTKKITRTRTYTNFDNSGCLGSVVKGVTPISKSISKQVEIKDCGLAQNIYIVGDKLSIHNNTDQTIRLRLFKVSKGRLLFQRVYMIHAHEHESIVTLDENSFYILKSLEQTWVGQSLLIPEALNNSAQTKNINLSSEGIVINE